MILNALEKFDVVLSRDTAWMLQIAVRPGPKLPGGTISDAALEYQKIGFTLRSKVNHAILRFEDEPETKTVDMTITEDEGWLIDQTVPFDGKGGAGTDLLLQTFRGFWKVEYQLPSDLVSEPSTPSLMLRVPPFYEEPT